MIPISKLKGDIGTTQVIADLVKKGYVIFTPLVCEALPFDLVAFKDSVFIKIQCKYSSDGFVPAKTSWTDKNGSHKKTYLDTDFDYYGIYLPDIDKVVYPSVKFKGAKIASEIRVSSTPFYWWEDFTEFTDKAEKRSIDRLGYTTRKCIDSSDFELVEIPKKEELRLMLLKNSIAKIAEQHRISGHVVSGWVQRYDLGTIKSKKNHINSPKRVKPKYPDKQELEKMIWETPTTILAKKLGVSDVALAKLCKRVGVQKPPRGYWAKKAAEKIE